MRVRVGIPQRLLKVEPIMGFIIPRHSFSIIFRPAPSVVHTGKHFAGVHPVVCGRAVHSTEEAPDHDSQRDKKKRDLRDVPTQRRDKIVSRQRVARDAAALPERDGLDRLAFGRGGDTSLSSPWRQLASTASPLESPIGIATGRRQTCGEFAHPKVVSRTHRERNSPAVLDRLLWPATVAGT